jgi:GDPmannose 4,6-dehydratase
MYLAEHLLAHGYSVYGLIRGQHNPKRERLEQLVPRLELVGGDLLDHSSLIAALESTQPDEVYNLGAISFVALSFTQAQLTGEITGLGVTRMLDAVRTVNPKIRFYQASSSEMFGKVRETPQRETTPFHPRSPYGVAKAYGHYITVNYRESYGLYAASGILFNHESPRRGYEFVTRKISHAVARIKRGLQHELVLGNLEARRDWGFAGDYVKAMHLMLQQPEADDYLVATGTSHSVGEYCEVAFGHVGLDWRDYVRTDARFQRPAEVDYLIGDATKARERLGWAPTVDFDGLVRMMVDADLEQVDQSRH